MQALLYEVLLGTTLPQAFVFRSSTGKSFVQALYHEVVLGSTLCQFCRTK